MTGCTRSAAPARRPAPNVLLITIDTLRADRVGAGITPTIDRLAASGMRFTAARAAAPLTLPSHTTIMTGLWPPAHGVRENGVDRLDERHATVARLLKAAGYRTSILGKNHVLPQRVYPWDVEITQGLAANRSVAVMAVSMAVTHTSPSP